MQLKCICLAVLLCAGVACAQGAHDAPHFAVATERNGLPVVAFETLGGFEYAPGSALPDAVRALDGKQVWIRGFMMPTEMKGSVVTGFMLVGGVAGCCFGAAPALNQFVVVTVDGPEGVDYSPDDPVWVLGRLSVGELRQGESVESVYRVRATQVDDSE